LAISIVMRFATLLLGLLISLPVWGESIHKLTIDGPIGPVTANYFLDGLETAEEEGAAAVLLEMNTPGGLDQAMRDIISGILNAEIPVITHVSPSGSRAASAGTYILYASHVAAMAPGTNLGAATPVQVGGGAPGMPEEEEPEEGNGDEEANGEEANGEEANGDEPVAGDAGERKMINDAVAYIRSLAELRGRNADWAERAVRESVSLSATEAAEKNVIDLTASSTEGLLEAIEGRVVSVMDREQTLELVGATIEDRPPDWRDELLSAITHPNVAYILLLVGMYGLIFELANPGALVPGTIGGISLLLALFALQALPVNLAGLGLLAFGVLLMLGEALAPSFGILGVGGVLAFGLGSLMLFEAGGPGFEISLALVIGVTAASLVIFTGTATLAMRAFQRRGVAGVSHLVDNEGEVISTDPSLRVKVEGESWQARSDASLNPGDHVRVVEVDGLTLHVEPLGNQGE